MKKDLKILEGLNPYPKAGKGWNTTPEGREALENAMRERDGGSVEPVVPTRRVVRPWAVGIGTAAVTLAVFVPLLLRGAPGGPVGVPIAPPSTATSTPGEASAPSPELLAYLLPISGAEVTSVNYIRTAGFQERLDRVDQCLRGEGFEFDFQSTTPPDLVLAGRNHVLPYDSLLKYGFIPTWSSRPPGFPRGEAYLQSLSDALEGLMPLPDGVTAAEAAAMVDAHQACALKVSGVGSEDRTTALIRFDQDYEMLAGNFEFLVRELDESHPEVVAALGAFRSCVELRGWALRTTRDDGSDIIDPVDPFLAAAQSAVFASEDPSVQEETDADAVTDLIACIEPVEKVRQPLRTQLRQSYVDDNWAALIGAQTRFAAALMELGLGTQD